MRKTTVSSGYMNTSEDKRTTETKAVAGRVLRRRIAQGSKSERRAVVLQTKDGDEFILRRKDGNAFRDDALDRLVGSTISAEGLVAGQTFIMSTWKVR